MDERIPAWIEQHVQFFKDGQSLKIRGGLMAHGGFLSRSNAVPSILQELCAKYNQGFAEEDVSAALDAVAPAPKVIGIDYVKLAQDWLGGYQGTYNLVRGEFQYIKDGKIKFKVPEDLAGTCAMDLAKCGPKGIQREHLTTAFRDLAQDLIQEHRQSLFESLNYVPGTDVEGDMFLEWLHTRFEIEGPLEDWMYVWKHSLYLAKRKFRAYLNGESVDLSCYRDMWVNLCGGQGIGKTEIIRNVMQPLGELYGQPTLNDILKGSKPASFIAEKLVLFIDELNRTGDGFSLSKSEAGRLKDFVSKDKITYTPLYSNTSKTVPVVAQFWSATNDSMFEIYKDTDSRRIFEFRLQTKKPFDDEAKARLVEGALVLWRSVDETREKGYYFPGTDTWDRIRKKQRLASVKRGTVYRFFERRHVAVDDPGMARKVGMDGLWKAYMKHCHEDNIRLTKNRDNFEADVKELHPGVEYFYIPTES